MFEKERGLQQGLLCENELSKQGVENWLERIFGWYGDKMDCVDTQIVQSQIIINKKTAAYLYSDFTPLEIKYQKGQRPQLEKLLDTILKPGMSQKEKFFAIMKRCRDNKDSRDSKIVFDGGTEEDIIKAGKYMCNEISRVFCILCQIAGLPSRVVGVHIAGHMMNEVYIDGKWGWCDTMKGTYAYLPNGKMASWWELMQDPTILDRQTKDVWKDVRPLQEPEFPEFRKTYLAITQERTRDVYLHPLEAAAIGNYFVNDHHKYDYPFRTTYADQPRNERACFVEHQMRVKMKYPHSFWNYHCFEGKLKTIK